jgi:hypothetical protein
MTDGRQELRKGSGKVFQDIWKTSQHYYVHSLDEAIRYSRTIDLFKWEWVWRIELGKRQPVS